MSSGALEASVIQLPRVAGGAGWERPHYQNPDNPLTLATLNLPSDSHDRYTRDEAWRPRCCLPVSTTIGADNCCTHRRSDPFKDEERQWNAPLTPWAACADPSNLKVEAGDRATLIDSSTALATSAKG